jgi:phage terminase large subunit-like protein
VTDSVTDYARAALAGQGGRPMSALERAAYQRHLDDMAHASERGYTWSVETSEWAIAFFAQLPHTKGKQWLGKPLELQPWQRFVVGSLFGWLRADGTRRFRRAYIEIARKNGKSTLAAGVALLLAFFDGESRAEVYIAATKREQAKIVFDEARAMVARTRGLRTRIKVAVGSLFSEASGSKLVPLGADADTTDGLNISGAIVDELHAHKKRDLVDVIDTATGARLNPLIFEITTAGSDRLSVCFEHHEYSARILSGVFQDDSWFAFITGMDPGDDWTLPESWAKANPNLGVSVGLDDLRAKCEKAQRVPADQNAFRRLHLNEWTEQEDRWLDMAAWRACGDAVDAHALEGRECFAGMDLSSTADLTAYVLVFGGDDGIVRVVPRFFLPEARVAARAERRDLAPLEMWVREGYLVATPGNVVDYEMVRAQLVADAARFNIREVAIDPWNATHLATQLASDGFTCIETRQGFATLSAPTKHLETLVLSRKIAHGQHPVLGWCASNVAVEMDPAGNIKPSKKRARDRIDGIVALVMGLDRLGRNTVEPSPNLSVWG